MAYSSSCARWTSTPGARRPTTPRKRVPRLSRTSAEPTSDIMPRGSHASTSAETPRKPGAITPRTVTGRSLSWIERPTIPGSAPKRLRQSPSDNTTSGAPSGVSASWGVKVRPRAASPPMSSKKPRLTSSPVMRSASPSPLSVRPLGSTATIGDRVRARSRQSRNSGTDA